MQPGSITIIGGGLAGCEAAWQAAQRGVPVVLYEMKPQRYSPAHENEDLAELVCSNSLRAARVDSAAGLLKEEMRRLGSLIMQAADATSVAAGAALAVDRSRFSAWISARIENHPAIQVIRQEVQSLPDADERKPLIIAAGPLVTSELAGELARLTGSGHLAFYDAIAPIVSAESLDMRVVFRKSRWDEDTPGDYLNCPLDRETYLRFIEALVGADKVPLKSFEEARYFEGCLPIEVMAERGLDTLRHGPLKPVGLAHPQSGERFHAVVQLRAENAEQSAYNLVGFQTKLTYGEQKRIFRTIPGLEQAEFLRLGSIHRNTFLCAPAVLRQDLSLQQALNIHVAGQLSGVEGYVESAAAGLLAGIHVSRKVLGLPVSLPPAESAHAALMRHLTQSDPAHFQPSNINFSLFVPLEGRIPKKQRAALRAEAALQAIDQWRHSLQAA
ncbi:MAG: methylenetetrahydrofolate--tRNA-(uracil(54)-C(5))-methyltransferase (FADH(2)-oxidizing) TrmFO [bacterium]|nr:methylenetetrahydrofolate--tRNA-(uracil(54)-C(5))-methyltransferase (FADH(2)-oxidizing) TrmFO [bacterium]